MVTTGATHALFCAIQTLLENGDECLMFEPFYTNYIEHVQFSGATPVTAAMVRDQETN